MSVWLCGREVPWQQVMDAVHGMVGDPGEDLLDIELRIPGGPAMKITPEIEIMSHEFARDREQDLKLAARDETKRQLLQAANHLAHMPPSQKWDGDFMR